MTASRTDAPAPSLFARLGLSPGRLGRAAVLLGVFGFIAAAYLPGSVVPDTISMCSQAVADVYTDWHSPVLSGLWGFVDVPIEAVFLLTLGVTVVSIHLIISRWLRPWVAVGCTAVVMLFPATLGWMGHVGKDEWFAAAFLAAVALLGRAGPERRRNVRRALLLGAAVCFWLAIAARKNALLPVGAALLVAWPLPTTVLGRLDARPLARRIICSGLVFVLLVVSVSAFGSIVVRPTAAHADQSTYLFDLAGISLEEHTMLVPPGTFPRGTTLADLNRAYDVKQGDAFFFGPDTFVNPFLSAVQVKRLRHAWLEEIRAHPADYVRNRLAYTWALLGISAPHPSGSVNDPGSVPATFGLDCSLHERYFPEVHDEVFDLLHDVEQWNVLRGWFFLLLLVAAAMAAGLRQVAEARVLLVGGVLSLAGLALLGISPVYRYSWFTAVCALLAVALALRKVPHLGRVPAPEPDIDGSRDGISSGIDADALDAPTDDVDSTDVAGAARAAKTLDPDGTDGYEFVRRHRA